MSLPCAPSPPHSEDSGFLKSSREAEVPPGSLPAPLWPEGQSLHPVGEGESVQV